VEERVMGKAGLPDVAARLREAREKSGLTQEQVARLLGTTNVQVSYWETGKRQIDLASLSRIADVYGYSMSWFLDQERDESHQVRVAFRAGDLSEEDLKEIAWARRFVRNLDFLMDISGAGRHE
jgi:transcriptional regulator with XRE-family HTH domain